MSKFSPLSGVYAWEFSVLGSEETRIQTNVNVTSKELFRMQEPVDGGVYDPHMGTTSLDWSCQTCMNRKTVCPGHIGSTDTVYPLKSPMFREHILKWLKAICLKCGSTMSEKHVRAPASKILTHYVKLAKLEKKCHKCGALHPTVVKNKLDQSNFYTETHIPGTTPVRSTLYNHTIKKIFSRVTDETVINMGQPLTSHPSKFILDTIRFPANTIRPDIRRLAGGRSNNHTTTALMKTLMEIKESLPKSIPEPSEITEELHTVLHNLDTIYFNMIKGSTATHNQIRVVTASNRTPVSISANIPKKYGRVRRNLLGKRVKNMIRSVITGDPTLKLSELGFPKHLAKDIYIPETVQVYNIHILEMYFKNGILVYPGCEGIRKKLNGKTYDIRYLDKDYKLQIGDIVYRNIIQGDIVIFNRAPSLTWTSVAAHKVVIIDNADTLRCNVSVCSFYNGDFDGDAMTALVPQNIQSRSEIEICSSVGNWINSYKNSAPLVGAFQDTLVGSAEFTTHGISLNKWHAMCMMSDVNIWRGLSFRKKVYTNREIYSMLLPKINLSGKRPNMYLPQYAAFLDYNPEDIQVRIDRGKLISGILDKSTLGQDSIGSIFHIINNEYGPTKALDTLFNIQHLISQFYYYNSLTTGVADFIVSDEIKLKIKEKITAMFLESRRITSKLDRRELISPIGTSQEEYFELQQMNAMEPGDDFITPILKSINFKTNGLAKLVLTGSKGNANNVIAINGALGNQKIEGDRFKKNFAWGRSSPYFTRYSTNPEALGYIAASYREGIPSFVYPFACGTARQGVISIALTTSVTGHQNRVAIKNFESIVVNNLRHSAKPQSIVQPLSLESGIDPRRTEKVKFPTVFISDAEMKKYHSSYKDFHGFDKSIQNILDEEFKVLIADRDLYRSIMLRIECNHPGNMLFDNTLQMPVNIYRIIEDTVYNFKDDIKFKSLDPVRTINKVKLLCDNIAYAYFNETQEVNGMQLPDHIVQATTLLQILLRSYLCTTPLLSRGITDALLDIICDKVKLVFHRSLLQYGTAIGIISAQSISEPITQLNLDTKHRAGASGKSKTNPIVRVMEIIGVRPTKSMKNPSMTVMVKEIYENDKLKVQDIANQIEMKKFSKFVNGTCVFFEEFGKPVHPKYVHEAKLIKNFQEHNAGLKMPIDLANWCIRFELNKEEMVINNISIEQIINSLQLKFPDIYLVYTPENAKDIIIRVYMRNVMKVSNGAAILLIMRSIQDSVISGISGIIATAVFGIVSSYRHEDGSIKTKKIWCIAATGSNLEAVMEHPDLDGYRSQTDSIVEFEEMFGITAARGKVVAELLKTINANRAHCTIYADEMSYSGQLTSIQKSGMAKREMNNVCLRLAFQSPNQILEDAALSGLVSKITGVSGPLICGSTPKIGTAYNQVIVNERFVKEFAQKISHIEDEL